MLCLKSYKADAHGTALGGLYCRLQNLPIPDKVAYSSSRGLREKLAEIV